MQKPHIPPIAVLFRNPQRKAIQCINEGYRIQFDCNSVSFKPNDWDQDRNETINDLLQKFQATLRVYQGKHFNKLNLYFHKSSGFDCVTFQKLGSFIGKHFRNLNQLNLDFFSCEDITETGLYCFCSSIYNSLKGLRSFEISIHGTSNINDRGVDHIRKLMLCHLKNLRKLILNFLAEEYNIPDEHFGFKFNPLERMQRLACVGSYYTLSGGIVLLIKAQLHSTIVELPTIETFKSLT